MKLSVVIPLYNKEKFIERCLNSLLVQDLASDEYEIIIVDDGSTDSSGTIVQRYSDAHGNIHFARQANAGPSAARNKAVQSAKGEYLYFLDADDLLAPNVLKTLVGLCEQNQLDILEFNTREMEEDAVMELPDTASIPPKGLAIAAMDGKSYIAEHDFRNQAWHYFIRSAFLRDTGIHFLEYMRAYEDMIFMASVLLQAKRTAKVNMEAHRYVKVSDSIVRNRDAAKNMKFIQAMVKCVEELDVLIKGLGDPEPNLTPVIRRLKGKQQAVVFALFVKAFKYRVLNRRDMDSILSKLRSLEAYPIDPGIGGIGDGNRVYNKLFVPLFNNRTLLFLGTGLIRLVPRN